MLPFKTLLGTLTQVTLRARLHWDIWWVYEGKDERPKHLPVMQKYSEFIRFDVHAHLTATITALYQLYEKKRGTRNLGVLLKRASSEPGVAASVTQAAASVFAGVEPLAKKVRILRNNAFGHRSLDIGYDDAFAKASITPFQLRDLSIASLEIVNHFHRGFGDADWPFNDYPIGHLRRLLRDLRDFHGLGPAA
jgi:AbiU2